MAALSRTTAERPLVELEADAPQATVAPVEGVPGAWRVGPLLSPAEAEVLIHASEALGYAKKISRRSGPPVRDNERLRYDAPPGITEALGARLHAALGGRVLPGFEAWRPLPPDSFLNPRWRLNRYAPGEVFRPHLDTGYELGPWRRSLLSLVLYLNDGFDAGETVFFPDGQRRDHMLPGERDADEIAFPPRAGWGLIFLHYGPLQPRHAGRPVAAGSGPKYILRTDLFFERDPRPVSALLFGRDPGCHRCLLLLGPPGAGKSTQARAAAARLGFDFVDFGHEVRRAAKEVGALGDEIRRARSRRAALQDAALGPSGAARRPGGWLPDALCHKLLERALPPASETSGVVIEGYPRMRSQSLSLEGDGWDLMAAVELQVDEATRRARLDARVLDPRSGAPGRVGEVPDGRRRPEDSAEGDAARWQDWLRDTWPLVEHYEKRRQRIPVDGGADAPTVTSAIAAAVSAQLLRRAEASFPSDLKEILSGMRSDGVSHASRPGALVYAYEGEGRPRLFLKLSAPWGADLATEARILGSAEAERLPLRPPRLVGLSPVGDVFALVTEALPGISAKAWALGLADDASRAAFVDALAAALRALHAAEPPPGLAAPDLEALLDRARARLAAGEVPARNFRPRYGIPLEGGALGEELDALVAEARHIPPSPPGLLHGDPCLPNLFVDDLGALTGCLDLGAMALGDARRDLAWAAWSVSHNLGEAWAERLLRAWGATPDDARAVALYRRLNRFLA